MKPRFVCLIAGLNACASMHVNVPPSATAKLWPEEKHLADPKQLTFGGENAEAYWSFDGKQLSFQAHTQAESCDRIYKMEALGPQAGAVSPVSSGEGATTCAHFFPNGQLLFASTHLGGAQCPPKPDMSQGYVWALYDTYDIFKANADGTGVRRLTETPGYDAEGTVCGKDGSIVFTSVRDGDIELYRMDADGKNVKRLTSDPGYDGGAFFNADCSKIVWRASRPRSGKELEDFRALLAKGLVRPSKLELFVMNADGSDQRQVTYLDSASFAPFWVPNEDRIVFSSNYGSPKGREFDLWAINADGTDLERITYAPGFDGFPMFSPDGKWLAFSSNRATADGKKDTNVFVARWVPGPVVSKPGAAERIKSDVQWLADPKREGRGVGTPGLTAAGEWLIGEFTKIGLKPLQESGDYRDRFSVVTQVKVAPATRLVLGGNVVSAEDFRPMGFSAQDKVKGPLVLAGYGISDSDLGVDDYKGLDVKGKVVLVRRFAPALSQLDTPEKQRRAGDLRKKAFIAREKGAKALLVVDWPGASKSAAMTPSEPMPEAVLPALQPEGTIKDAGIPVLVLKRSVLKELMPALEKTPRKAFVAELEVALEFVQSDAFNVAGKLKGNGSSRGPLVIGAHYDHLGYGGGHSLAPDRHEPHLGADDNASGVAGILEIARALARKSDTLKRDVIFIAFSGEESGVLGSSHWVAQQKAVLSPGAVMVNLDMVGRMRSNTVTVLGNESADEWKGLLEAACGKLRMQCNMSGDGYGPSDQTSFYSAGLPVLHFFTGAHSDYHKPTDHPSKLTYSGTARIAELVAEVAHTLPDGALTFKKSSPPAPRGDSRSFGASLGTIPDYGGPPPGVKGVLLQDVRAGGGAEKAGMRRGDVLIRLGKHEIGSVEDLMFVLTSSKPGETVRAAVLRDGREVGFEVTFQETRKH